MEEMQATSAYHGKWMGNTEAPEVCAFAKITRKGKLGNRGIQLLPNRIVNKKDLDNLLPNHNALPDELKKSFINAHGKHTANLFREPDHDHPDLFYPFYLSSKEGFMNDDIKFTTNFWKSLARIPSKARYEGFQMSVIGRFGQRWRNVLLNIIKLILVMRFVPPELRQMARFPIPKPGKHNEYRPISLCSDIYCFINAVITSYTSLGIEKSNILHEGMCAYRRGKGCSSLVTMELSFREDCHENNLPVLQLDEDEEKFFDRIPVEVLLAAMRINGFPSQGFLEIKASAMQPKLVEIITSKGIAFAKFVCGLEQGNPDSPTVSNLVIKLKHDIWNHLTNKVRNMFKQETNDPNIVHTSTNTPESYTFCNKTRNNTSVNMNKIGYCDDNTKFCCTRHEEDLIFLSSYFLQLSGDLSMVTKIGRRSSKCELHFFNISAEMAVRLKKCWSTAWSFLDDCPVQEAVPFKIQLKSDELQKLYSLIDYFELDDEQRARWDKIIHPSSHKHLGLKCTLGGNTMSSCRETLSKIRDRIGVLKLQNMHSDAQVKCVSMLCATMHSFVPLQTQYKTKDLAEVDKAISNSIIKRQGLSSTDALHRLYLPMRMGGKGFISLLDQDVVSVARELEIISNLSTLEGEAFNTRVEACCHYNLEDDSHIVNHARAAIIKLAKFGIFLLHKQDDIINNVLSELNILGGYASIGCASYKDGNACSFGEGKNRNISLAYGGKMWRTLSAWKHNGYRWDNSTIMVARSNKLNIEQIQFHTKKILEKRFKNIASMFSFWEWRNSSFDETYISDSVKDWKFFDIPKIIGHIYPNEYLYFSDSKIKCIAKNILQINGWNLNSSDQGNHRKTEYNPYSFYHNMFHLIIQSGSPLFISTDGAHEVCVHSEKKTSGSFVISIADIREHETISTGEWIHRPFKPLLSRASMLPNRIGTVASDIATGEMWAYAFSELSLHKSIPRVVITDSKSTRNILLSLRSLDSTSYIDRTYIRSVAGGISKYLLSLFETQLWNFEKDTQALPSTFYSYFATKLRELCNFGQTWTSKTKDNSDEDDPKLWENSYYDRHPYRSIWKVNSHQLNNSGTDIKSSPRYAQLIPNLGILSTNHHADRSAGIIMKFAHAPPNINISYSSMEFALMWNGQIVDRHISDVLWEAFALEREKRLQTKATQGLLWRWKNTVSFSWDYLNLHKGWFRCLLGLSRTHTRSLYKNKRYRLCCGKMKSDSLQEANSCSNMVQYTQQKQIDLLSHCMWCNHHEKGNRKHALINCDKTELRDFRKHLTALINSKLQHFFTQFSSYTSINGMTKVIRDIEQLFLKHQHLQTGRLSKKPAFRNNSYRNINDLLLKWNQPSLEIALQDINCHLISEIFNLLPNTHPLDKGDEELGIIDSLWLGLVPMFLDNFMNACCKELDGSYYHRSTKAGICRELTEFWQEIKTLIMSKAAGLHKIIGIAGKVFEKEILIKYGSDIPPQGILNTLDITTSNCARTKVINVKKRKRNGKKSTQGNDTTHVFNKRCNLNLNTSTRQCEGITCSRDALFWCLGCNFSSNQIKSTHKQCHRCGTYMTALKRIQQILLSIQKSKNKQNNVQQIINFCNQHTESLSHKYRPLMNLLKIFLPSELQIHKAEFTSKQKLKNIPERHKLACRLFLRSITYASRKFSDNVNIISFAHAVTSKAITDKNENLNISQNATHVSPITQPMQDKSSPTASVKLRNREAIEANGSSWLSGMGITKSYDILRSQNIPGIYFGNTESTTILQNWGPFKKWEDFARIFGSERVIDEKPNGIYLIPIFSGHEKGGHWHLIVVNKRHNCTAWILDSLNNADSQSYVHRIIKSLFCSRNRRFHWIIERCLPQTELECGIRVVHSSRIITEDINNGIDLEDGIKKATLMHLEHGHYDSRTLRRYVSLFLNTHENHMITTLSRRRRLNLNGSSVNNRRNTRRKKLVNKSSTNDGKKIDVIYIPE